jgi:hypothetical protein
MDSKKYSRHELTNNGMWHRQLTWCEDREDKQGVDVDGV